MQTDVLLQPLEQRPKTLDRVRNFTPDEINNRIDEAMIRRIWQYSRRSREEITQRIQELDREWDIERVLETNAAMMALTGVVLSAFSTRRWLLLPAAVLASLLQHALFRKSTPVHVLRRLGVRTRREIEAEKYALRMLRGDFDRLQNVSEENHRAIEVLRLSRP